METVPVLERLRALIKAKSITTENEQRIISPLGSDYRWLIDMRPTFLDGEALETCASAFWTRFSERQPFQIGGLEMAAVPLITAIVSEGWRRGTPVNGFIVRKERKPHGLCRRIEGGLTEDPIVIVDDLVNGGSSLEVVRVALEEVKRDIASVFVIVDFRNPALRARLERSGIEVESLLTMSELGFDPFPERESDPQAGFEIVWRSKAGAPNYFHIVPKSSPALDEDRLYVGSDDGTFRALDQATGSEQWRTNIDDPRRKGVFSSPALHEGRVYFGGYDGCVRCLDCRSGEPIWRFSGADWVGSSPVLAPELGRLFIGLEHASPRAPGSIAALDLALGKKVWERECAAYVHGTPVWVSKHGAVACGGNDGRLRWLEAHEGTERWAYAAAGEIKAQPVFDSVNDQLLFGAFDGGIHAVDIATGTRRWRVDTHDIVYSTPLVVGPRAFVAGTDKYLHVVELESGEEVAQLFTGARIFCSPRLVAGRVLFGNTAGELYELDPETLEVTAFAQFPERITCQVRYGSNHGLYFVTTYDNEVFALRRRT